MNVKVLMEIEKKFKSKEFNFAQASFALITAGCNSNEANALLKYWS